MTKQEKRLWYDYMAKHTVRWYKQRIIDNFIVDFYCSKAKLVVELDGSQHFTEQGEAYDKERTAILESYGIKVVRFSNYDVDSNFEGVCLEIDRIVKERLKQPPQTKSAILPAPPEAGSLFSAFLFRGRGTASAVEGANSSTSLKYEQYVQ